MKPLSEELHPGCAEASGVALAAHRRLDGGAFCRPKQECSVSAESLLKRLISMTLSGLQNSFVIAPPHRTESDLLRRVRRWLDALEIDSPKLARLLCKIIPANCPFERDIQLFRRTLFHIPPLCKLNPFYEQFVGLRFRALSFLADECGEDISAYCR